MSTGNAEIPPIGLGTARMEGNECRSAVRTALELGYRHVDTAQMYGNEAEVGEAVNNSRVDREEVFITTKIDRGNTGFQDSIESVNQSLKRLDTDYVDLLLIHAPPRKGLAETLEAMNSLQRQDKVEHIGVSNFSIQQLEKAREESSNPVVTNQVKYNPYHQDPEMLHYCRQNDIILTGYSPLAVGKAVEDPEIREIADNHGRSPAQVVLKWLLDKQIVVIPKASKKSHLKENVELSGFQLTENEKQRLDNMDRGFMSRIKSIF